MTPNFKSIAARHVCAAHFAFRGASAGTALGAIACLAANRWRFRIVHLMELMIALALIMSLWSCYVDAQ